MRPRTLILWCVALSLECSAARADWRWFVPKPTENGAFFDVFGSFEGDESRASAQSFRWYDTFFKQKLTLFSNGYFYHPRLLQYQVSLAGALKQEEFRASYLESRGWSHGTGTEYDTKLFVLPEHPYNLELFALRYEPLFKEQAATLHHNVQTSKGALFRYRRLPYLFHARYNDTSVVSAVSSSQVTRKGLEGEYFKHFTNGVQLSLNAAYNPSRFSNSLGLDGTTADSAFGNFVDWKRVRLSSNVTHTRFDQESGSSGSFGNDQFAWYELLTASLPVNLRSNISYRYQDNESTVPGGVLGNRTLSDVRRDFQLDLFHRLYQSLDTTYSFRDGSRTSSGGDTTSRSHALSLSYTKVIPRGRILAGLNLGRGDLDQRGRADVASEPHLATPVPGTFSLGQQDAEAQSVVVFLKSPLPPFDLVQLTENVHYTITVVSSTLDITVLTLPPLFAVPGTYDFYVAYSLTTGEFDLRTNTAAYNASVELFDTKLTPYYSYAAVRTDVTSGIFPGSALDSTTSTVGLYFHRGPLRARGEYQDVDWLVSPYRAWKAEAQYVGSASPTTRIYATATYLHKHFPQGTSIQLGEAYTDESASASGSFSRQIPSKNLALSAGGSYSRLLGLVDGSAYALNASLTWKIGKLDLTTGASAYRSDTQGLTGVSSNRFHDYYYVSLRRRLF